MKFTIENYLQQHISVIQKLDHQEIENAINLIKEISKKENRIAVCGNGGSAVAASHYVTDWNKMVYAHTGLKFNGICLSDNIGLITAYSNDLSYDEVFSEQVKNLLNPGDLLITLSGSGNSENVVRATLTAKEMNIKTLTICGFDGGRLKKVSDNFVWIRSNDMQLCEDAHTVFGHMVTKSLCGQDLSV